MCPFDAYGCQFIKLFSSNLKKLEIKLLPVIQSINIFKLFELPINKKLRLLYSKKGSSCGT